MSPNLKVQRGFLSFKSLKGVQNTHGSIRTLETIVHSVLVCEKKGKQLCELVRILSSQHCFR